MSKTNNDKAKETIIDTTISLIEQSGGDIRNITARAIAEKSGVSLGLINYHFGSKDNLIAVCSDRIINRKVMNYSPDNNEYLADDGLTDRERLIFYAQQTFDFIFANQAISKISILTDLKDYTPHCNSALTQQGFLLALRGSLPAEKKKHIAFSLASVMQAAFLAGDNSKAITGYDLNSKEQRDSFISDTVNMLMESSYEG